jgi:carboxymethylenebutenolidase
MINSEIIRLYDEYTHKPLTRKHFITELIRLTGSMAAAMSILPSLEANYSEYGTSVSTDGLITERVEWDVPHGKMKGYLSRPEADKKYPGVIIIHENRGLNPHIEDVTRRAAHAGFLALAPDALSLTGGTPEDADVARQQIGALDANINLSNFIHAVKYLAERKDCSGKTGCIGFCWGGYMANQLAVHSSDLNAAIAFYGRQAAASDVSDIKAAIQLHYAETDERVNAGIDVYVNALKEHQKTFEMYMYPEVGHAFHNDTSAARYNAEAASLAWGRTISFLEKHLK